MMDAKRVSPVETSSVVNPRLKFRLRYCECGAAGVSWDELKFHGKSGHQTYLLFAKTLEVIRSFRNALQASMC